MEIRPKVDLDVAIIFKLINNSTKRIQKKFIFNQYLEIGERRLQPNFANFNLDFLSKYR